jgi:hypothetical protein
VFTMVRNTHPATLQAQVTVDLESYVCPTQFPASLADADAWAFVQARVERYRKKFRELQAREEEIEHRERARARLIAGGKNYALLETLSWDREDKAEATREVELELAAEVRWDWKEEEVKELVDETLDEWDEEPGDDDEDDED